MEPFRILRSVEHEGVVYAPGDEPALAASGIDLKMLADLSIIRSERWYTDAGAASATGPGPSAPETPTPAPRPPTSPPRPPAQPPRRRPAGARA